MKKFAKLVLLFSVSFVIVMLTAASLRFLSLRVDWAKSLPQKSETTLTLMITAAHWALSLAMFSSILFSISYAFRRGYFASMAIVIVMVLSVLFTHGLFIFLNNWKIASAAAAPAQTVGLSPGDKGLLLSNSLNREETVVVLLKGTEDPMGPRVVAIPGQPLIFQEEAAVGSTLPPVPFGDDTPWFLKSLAIDLRLNSELLQQKYDEGFVSFSLYTGSLIFFLCALAYAIKFSAWPLANLFLGILAFRGVLTLETFLNSPEIQEIMGAFLKNMLPVSRVAPLIFLFFGVLLLLYSWLIYLSKRKYDDEY